MSDKPEKPTGQWKPEKQTGTIFRLRVDGFVVTMACLGAIIGFLFFSSGSLLIRGIESFDSWAGSVISWVAPLIGVAIFGGVAYFLRRWVFLAIAIVFGLWFIIDVIMSGGF